MSQPFYASPLFAPLQPWLERLPTKPDTQALVELARAFPIWVNAEQLKFVAPQDDGLAYECRIWARGEVATRPDNWHDFFNALVWMTFPYTKIALSAAHVDAMQAPGEKRGMIRDALTHFDECGIVVLSTETELLDLLRDFRWRELFAEHREAVKQKMRFIVFGHATYENLLQPFRGLTAKAVLHEVTAEWLSLAPGALAAAVDRFLAAELKSGKYTRPRDFQPLPLLGIPGVVRENENPDYYDDTWQFRPGRQRGAV